MDAFSREALRRLPLAEALMRCWQFALDAETLDAIFDRHRGRSYQKVLSFSTIVHLTADALLEHQGSAHQAIKRSEQEDELPASMEAVYGKLRRIPIGLSNGFLLEGTQRLSELLPATRRSTLPRSLRRFCAMIIDGKKIKRVPRMLKPARNVKAMVMGGKTLAALCWNSGLVVAIHADPDGQAGDQPLVPELLRQVREVLKELRLWIADRQFCDLIQTERFTAEGDHFLIRYNSKVTFTRDSSFRIRRGVDENRNGYVEEWGWLGKPTDKRRRHVRRITLTRKSPKGTKPLEPVILITDLLDADEFPAVDLLEAYLERWSIECVFQKITEVFHLQNLISTTPEGTVFQFAFCMLLYNMIQLLTRYLSAEENIPASDVSQENLFYDVHRQLIAWAELIGPALTVEHLQSFPKAADLRERLKELLADVWTERWRKAPRKKHAKPRQASAEVPGAHTSMYRILRDAAASGHRLRKKE
jgi:Transposase DDE domain